MIEDTSRITRGTHDSGSVVDVVVSMRRLSKFFMQAEFKIARHFEMMAKSLRKVSLQSDYVLFPPALPEVLTKSMKMEKALKFAQKPHSMTKQNNFDRTGKPKH